MSTKAVLGLIAAVIIVGGGVWYFSSSGGSQTGTENEAQEGASGAATFADLIARAGSWKCEVSMSVEEAPSEGVAYISGGKIRADFTSTPAATGQPVTSHMIQADGYAYTWSDMYPQGMKILIPEGQETSTSASGGVDYDSRVEYSCAPWVADASLFTPPADVTFMELGANGMPNIPMPN